uniref:Uncharacterized protein n=1 Tax=Anguilla anguilla TaxID=7936 RepID=A0A0E9WHH1_ANGAN
MLSERCIPQERLGENGNVKLFTRQVEVLQTDIKELLFGESGMARLSFIELAAAMTIYYRRPSITMARGMILSARFSRVGCDS